MAVIKPTINRLTNNTVAVTWTPVTEADTCHPTPNELADFGDRSVQVAGTLGGTSVALHGSLDGTNYSALKNSARSTIALTSAGTLSEVLEGTPQVKPVLTGGTSVSISITVFARRNRGGKEA